MVDLLDAQWACLTCNTKFPLGRMRLGGRSGGLRCPNCDDDNTLPARGQTVELEEGFEHQETIQ